MMSKQNFSWPYCVIVAHLLKLCQNKLAMDMFDNLLVICWSYVKTETSLGHCWYFVGRLLVISKWFVEFIAKHKKFSCQLFVMSWWLVEIMSKQKLLLVISFVFPTIHVCLLFCLFLGSMMMMKTIETCRVVAWDTVALERCRPLKTWDTLLTLTM